MNLKELPVSEKTVLVRVDFNIPLDKEKTITDDTKIRASLPTIRYLLDKGAAVILMSHLGRPKGSFNSDLSLKPCALRLEELLGQKVEFANDCVGEDAREKGTVLKPGQVLLLENLRFYDAEEHPEKDPSFAKQLASLADFYVNDAFGTAHRDHSSTATIAKYFLGRSAPGFLLEKEVSFLGEHFQKPDHPFYAIIGGAKISSKLGVLTSLLSKVDALFIGGGMAYTFLKAKGIAIGNSLYEEELLPKAQSFLQAAIQKKIPVYLPVDLVIANAFSKDATHKTIEVDQGIEEGWEGMDIGPATRSEWASALKKAKMVFWNGPLGVFEFEIFAAGTSAIAKALSKLDATTIIGGGDSVAAINHLNIADKFSHISTGGGASLEYIEYGHLPGIDALSQR